MKTAVTQPQARPGLQMRRTLARERFEEKIRKVGQLIKLSATAKSPPAREEAQAAPDTLQTRTDITDRSAKSED